MNESRSDRIVGEEKENGRGKKNRIIDKINTEIKKEADLLIWERAGDLYQIVVVVDCYCCDNTFIFIS